MLPNIYTELRLCFFVFFCFTLQDEFRKLLNAGLTVAQITKLLEINGKKVPRKKKDELVGDLMSFFLIQHRAKSN